jgi:hypothetical protein
MIAQFSLRLICGMSLMWVLMPRSQVTTGFFRIQMLVVLGLAVLAALTLGLGSPASADAQPILPHTAAVAGCVGIAAAAYLGSVFWTLGRRMAGTVFVVLIALASAILLPAIVVPANEFPSSRGWMVALSEWASAAVLGAAVTGMLLGHWYLTAPTMSIAPLNRLNAFLGAAAVCRLIVSSIGLSMAGNEAITGTHGLWLAMRWLAGILGPIVVSIMVWRILKYRNTQSATGVLFVGVILSFIGEMSAVLLFRELHLPV